MKTLEMTRNAYAIWCVFCQGKLPAFHPGISCGIDKHCSGDGEGDKLFKSRFLGRYIFNNAYLTRLLSVQTSSAAFELILCCCTSGGRLECCSGKSLVLEETPTHPCHWRTCFSYSEMVIAWKSHNTAAFPCKPREFQIFWNKPNFFYDHNSNFASNFMGTS